MATSRCFLLYFVFLAIWDRGQGTTPTKWAVSEKLGEVGPFLKAGTAEHARELISRHMQSTIDSMPSSVARHVKQMHTGDAWRAIFEMATGRSSLTVEVATKVRDALQRGVLDVLLELIRFALGFLSGILDPLWIGNQRFNGTQEGVQVRLWLENVRILNLMASHITKYGVSITRLCAFGDVVLPQLDILGYYDLDGSADVEGTTMKIFGDGPMAVQVTNSTTHAELCLAFPEGVFAIQLQNLDMSIGRFKVNVGNLFHDEAVAELISGIASDVGPAVVEEFEPTISKIIMDAVNKAIKDFFPFSVLHELFGDGNVNKEETLQEV